MKNLSVKIIAFSALLLSFSQAYGQLADQGNGKAAAIKEVLIEFLGKGESVELRMRYALPEVLGITVDKNASKNAVWAIDGGDGTQAVLISTAEGERFFGYYEKYIRTFQGAVAQGYKRPEGEGPSYLRLTVQWSGSAAIVCALTPSADKDWAMFGKLVADFSKKTNIDMTKNLERVYNN